MLSYADISDRNFRHLDTAADELEGAAEEFTNTKEDYAQHVTRHWDDGASWQGLSANSAALRFARTEEELAAAATQARSLAAVIREGVTELRRVQEELTALAESAREAGFRISGSGDVHDALDRSHIPELQDTRHEWQARVNELIAQANEADYNLRSALTEIIRSGDGREGGIFNGSSFESENQILAARAAELAERLANGEELTRGQWEQLNRLLRFNSDNAEFSRDLLTDLGAEGLIELSARIAEQAAEDGDSALGRRFHTLNNGLAAALAMATRAPAQDYHEWARTPAGHFYAEFMEDLREAGRAEYGVGLTDLDDVHGYQLLVGMMNAADGVADDFSARFLHDLADDVRAAEDPDQGGHPGLWRLSTDDMGVDGIDDADRAALAVDPLDGLLGIMSHQPGVAASYLDPGHHNDRLEYLLTKRDWDQLSISMGTTAVNYPSGLDGLGAALQAATTGVPPDVGPSTRGIEVTGAGARVMHDVVETLSANNAALIADDGTFQALRPQLARMTAAYMGDFQLAVSNMELVPEAEGIVELDRQSTIAFLGQLGRDQEAHGIITGAQQAYTTWAIERAFRQSLDEGLGWDVRVENAVGSGAQIAGIMSQARADAVYETQIAADEEYNDRLDTVQGWTGMVLDEIVGPVAERAGAAGPIIEWGVSELSDSIFSTMRQDNSEEAAQNAGDSYETGYQAAIDSAKAAVTLAAASEFSEDSQAMVDLRNAAARAVASHFGNAIGWETPNSEK